MNDTPTDPARLTAVVDYHTVGSLLREVLFPPMTVGIFLTRAGSGLLGLAAWMVTALAIAMVLMRFDVARTTAGMVGVVTPVIVVIVLNSLGVFNRRGAGAKPLRQFHEWLLAVASRGMGLEATHIVAAHVDADQALQLQVSRLVAATGRQAAARSVAVVLSVELEPRQPRGHKRRAHRTA
ncbi:hypothetical protein [Accumulibacter sp.]|uniref:hypothetical protein n=1 Tax=Accumulibacter sp. TaxID=2053492 RepID=UPI002B7A4882|nr:hypothetical protein [Accumulibacter sp.]HMW57004.1 hypothetical protein [Accumulibacter sp.]HNC21716.1 hypothetical protein [Accumulibacter sp.]